MKRNRGIIISIMVWCAWSVWGQSVLSLAYPFGLPLRSLSSTALSMGGVSTGMPNDHNVMLTNPGNLGTIDITAFSSLWVADYLRIHDNGSYTDHMRTVPLQLSFALPLSQAGTIAFSLQKTTDATIKYRGAMEPVSITNIGELVKTRKSFDREGGTTSWQAGWGRRFGSYINIGLAYQRLFFSSDGTKLTDILYTLTTAENKLDTTYENTVRDSTHLSFRGNGIRFGILGTIKKFAVGIAVNFFFEDHLSYFSAIYNGSSRDPIHIAVEEHGRDTLQLPYSIATGLSYEISPKWLVGADLNLDLWNYYSLDGLQVLSDIETENTVSLSAGFRFIPAPNLLVPKYFETVHYRGGIRYSQLPGKISSEFAGSFGFGLPLKGNGLLDIGCEIGRRTHENYSNYDETFVHILLGLNGGRKWNKTPTSTY